MALLEAHRRDIEAAREPGEAVRLVKQADAIRYLTKKADLGEEIQDDAAEMAIRARRKAGELLEKSLRGPEEGRPGKVSHAATLIEPTTLGEIGVSRSDSSRWQAMASLPEEKFEEALRETRAQGRRLSTEAMVRVARTHLGPALATVDGARQNGLGEGFRSNDRRTAKQRLSQVARLLPEKMGYASGYVNQALELDWTLNPSKADGLLEVIARYRDELNHLEEILKALPDAEQSETSPSASHTRT